MILIYLLFVLIIIPIIFILVRLILDLIVGVFGKISYDGFFAFGFAYDAEKEIFYSTKNAWQKNFGYTHMYDVLAPVFRMIIDTEPIRFYYNHKNWLITFWKGQYGIVTGAEIGVYCTNDERVNKRTVYFPVDDSEMLEMDFRLYKKGKLITSVKASHWWLAVFKLGMFSNPGELIMDININFPNAEMLWAFIDGFKKLGYKEEEYLIIDRTFCFKYEVPKTRKVWTRNRFLDSIRQFFNRRNVKLYNNWLEGMIDNNKIDDSINRDKKLIMINELLPDLVKNKKDNVNSKEILEKIFNKRDDNIIFLDRDDGDIGRENIYE